MGVAYLLILGRRVEAGLAGGCGGGSGGSGGGSWREDGLAGCQTSVAAETPPVSLSASVLSR